MKTQQKKHYFYPVEASASVPLQQIHTTITKPPQTKVKEKYKVKNERNVYMYVRVCVICVHNWGIYDSHIWKDILRVYLITS